MYQHRAEKDNLSRYPGTLVLVGYSCSILDTRAHTKSFLCYYRVLVTYPGNQTDYQGTREFTPNKITP